LAKVKTPNQLTVGLQRQPAESILTPKRVLTRTNSRNFLRAIVALILWGILICVISAVYEIWRLENNWRLRIPA
jgi:hypothetical protein